MRTTSFFIDSLLSLKVDKSFFIDILHWYDIHKSIIQTYKNKCSDNQMFWNFATSKYSFILGIRFFSWEIPLNKREFIGD